MKPKNRVILIMGLIAVFLMSIVSPGIASPTSEQTSEGKPVSVFKDVSSDDVNLAFINYLSGKGIIKGFPDGGFHPTEGLTRAQAAAIMVLAGAIKADSAQPSPFPDVRADHWARASIASAVKAGYISGFPDKSYRPDDKITRAQAANMILRLSKQSLNGAKLPQLSDMNSSHWAAPAVAVGIASGMLSLSTDSQKVYPEQAISRGDLARALGVLLTKDPDLSQAALIGRIEVKSGSVTIQNGSKEAQNITGSSVISAGDTLTTDKNAEASISYGDGSSLLVKGDTQLSVKEARGRSYIKTNGSSGIAVDWLLVDLKKGKLFGALASHTETQENQSSNDKKTTGNLENRKFIASLSGRDFIGAASASEQNMPWYETSKTKKVKVKVDMPWGVAAIRGTFWHNAVNNNGTGSTSILTGTGDVTAGGQTVSLVAGQATQGTGANTPPEPPAPMSPSQMGEWAQAASWAQQTAQAIQQNQEAAPPQAPGPNQTGNTPPPNLVQNINNAIQAAQNGQGNPSSNSNSGSGSTPPPPGPEVDPTVTYGTYSLSNRVVLPGAPNNVLTQGLNITPSALLSSLGTTSYGIYTRLAEGTYFPLSAPEPIATEVRLLQKVISQPDNLLVCFFAGQPTQQQSPVAVARLSGGQLISIDRTISGTISLPAGMVAPAGGIHIEVNANQQYFPMPFHREITIPEGANSASYNVQVPANAADGYYISYYISSDTEAYIKHGHYNTPVDVSSVSKSSINMSILAGKKISGSISLPQPNPADPLWVNILAENTDSHEVFQQGLEVTSSAVFNVMVMPGHQYKLSYRVNDNEGQAYLTTNNILGHAYYSGTGMKAWSGDAACLQVDDNLAAINLATLAGTKITGKVTLPGDGPEAPQSIAINVIAQSSGEYYSTSCDIVAGQRESAIYQMVVPNGTYNIRFMVENGSTYDTPNVCVPDTIEVNKEISIPPQLSQTQMELPIKLIADNSLVVGRRVFCLNSPNFTGNAVLNALNPEFKKVYVKISDKWFNLMEAEDYSYLNNEHQINGLEALPLVPKLLVNYNVNGHLVEISGGNWSSTDTLVIKFVDTEGNNVEDAIKENTIIKDGPGLVKLTLDRSKLADNRQYLIVIWKDDDTIFIVPIRTSC